MAVNKKMIILGLVIIGIIGWLVFNQSPNLPPAEREALVADYLKVNLRQWSAVSPVCRQPFAIYNLEFTDKNDGTVFYEDGYNVYSADFTYRLDRNNQVVITHFAEPFPIHLSGEVCPD
ncbi:MAG: hypothetical protein WDZ85_01930 [Candidatus Paceibacterota bacterium]